MKIYQIYVHGRRAVTLAELITVKSENSQVFINRGIT